MPCVDKPLSELYLYNGINPRPDDFDEFWERGLAEMRAIDPRPEFKPYPSSSAIADLFELTFTSTKGARIYAKFARPKNIKGRIPAVLQFHGLSGSSSAWCELLNYVSQGYAVAFMDCRGQGGKSEDVGGQGGTTYSTPFTRGLGGDPDNLYLRDVFLDTAMVARVVMELDYVDETRVGVMGGSQGGGLSIACAALVPEIKLCASNFPYMSDYKRVFEMDLDKDAYEGLRYYFRWYDPSHEREDEIFKKLGYVDIQYLAPRIRAKVLMATCLRDTICPPSTQFAMYNKITSEKSVKIYHDYAHEIPRFHVDKMFEFMAEL